MAVSSWVPFMLQDILDEDPKMIIKMGSKEPQILVSI